MIKVFHVISHFDLGGAERVATNIAKSQSANFEYHIFEVARGHSDYTRQMIDEFRTDNIKYHRSPIRNVKLAITLFPFRLFFYSVFKRPTVIHCHTEVPDLSVFLCFLIFAPFFKNTSIVRTIHSTQLWNGWKRIGEKVETFFIKRQANVAISNAAKTNYENVHQQKNIPLIYNGITQCSQIPFPTLKNDKLNILFAGRLEETKGIDELIAVAKGLQTDPRFHFFVVGDGTMREKMNAAFQSSTNVTCLPTIYNIAQYLGSFDYLFMPSRFEGLGLLAIEAGFNNLPTILNDCPGLNETVPEDWPFKVSDNSVEAYLEIFRNQIFSQDKEVLIKAAYEYVNKIFSTNKMQRAYEQLYRSKLNIED